MFLKALMIMIVAAGFAVAVPKAVRAITGLQAAPSAVQVVVQPGDTLWSIASRYGMGQSSRRDIRQVVWEIRKANNLSSAVIHPDMVLIIPAL